MTATTSPQPPPHIEDDAVSLIRDLCLVAGDYEAVLEAMSKSAAERGFDAFLSTASIALLITYSRCLDGPVPLPDSPTSKENR